MKVWHFISGDLWAGAEAMACTLLAGLGRQGDISPAALLLNDGILADKLRERGVPVVVVDERRHSFWSLVRAARRVLAAAPADIIHSHRYKENLLAFLACHPGRRVPLVTTQHGLPEPSGKGPRGRIVDRANSLLLARGVVQTVAVAADIRDQYLIPRGVAGGRSRVIHNGIEIPAPAPPVDRQRLVLGSAGRLVAVKDFPLLIEVARALTAAGGAVSFRIAGEGPERRALETLVSAAGPGVDIRLEGGVEDIDGFYRQLDIYLNTSRHEGMPMSVLEAMARGVPVVAPDVGGLKDLVTHGTEGFLVDSRDPARFAEACLHLTRNPALRRRMGRAARQKVIERFSAAAMTGAYARLYREVAAQRNGKAGAGDA